MLHYVLILDDDAEARRQLSNTLIDAGFAVREARSRLEALGLVAQCRPDLAYLDLNLANGETWSFAAELLTHGIDLPLVVMTGDGTAHTAAGRLGAVGYLSKPFTGDKVLREISALPITRAPVRAMISRQGEDPLLPRVTCASTPGRLRPARGFAAGLRLSTPRESERESITPPAHGGGLLTASEAVDGMMDTEINVGQ